MQQILSNTYLRRYFIVITVLSFAIAGLLRYLFLPIWDQSLSLSTIQVVASLIEKFLTSFMVTVLIGFHTFWLQPKTSVKVAISIVEPKEIYTLLLESIQATDKWWFKGGTGRYTRAVTLPKMAESARKSSSSKEFHIQLIDPTNIRLCEQYANYRRGLKSSKQGEEWDLNRVRKEIYATLLCVLKTAHEFPALKLKVTLLNSFSSFRVDISKNYVIITREDPQAPGVKCDVETYFYEAYMNELILSEAQGRALDIPITMPHNLSLSAVRETLSELNLIDATLPDEILLDAIEAADSPINPYD